MEIEDLKLAQAMLSYLRSHENRVNADDIENFWEAESIGQASPKRIKIVDYLKRLELLEETPNRYYYIITPAGLKVQEQGLVNAVRSAALVERLESILAVPDPALRLQPAITGRALGAVSSAVRAGNASEAVDRAHTALHGYLKSLCDEENIAYGAEASVTELFKKLRAENPGLSPSGPRANEVNTIAKASASMIDSLNTIRNQASMAHPGNMLDEPEAFLVINCVRTLLHFLDMRLARPGGTAPSN